MLPCFLSKIGTLGKRTKRSSNKWRTAANNFNLTAKDERTQMNVKTLIGELLVFVQRAFVLVKTVFQKVIAPKGGCWSLDILPAEEN